MNLSPLPGSPLLMEQKSEAQTYQRSLGSIEEPTEWFDSTSAMSVPSAGGVFDNVFVFNQDTAPGGGGIFLISWQCTITIGDSGAFCIPIAQPINDTTR